MPEALEVATRALVLIMYAGAGTVAVLAWCGSKTWARRVAAITIVVTALGWVAFYGYLLGFDFHSAKSTTNVTMLSRVMHYVTATGLYISAYMILISERVNGALDE
jgi:hypothetical protein